MKPSRKPAPRASDSVPDDLKPFFDEIARIIAAAVMREMNAPAERKEVVHDTR